MPTVDPIQKCYFKVVGVFDQHVHINATGGAGVSWSYPVTVANEPVRQLMSLPAIDRASQIFSKRTNIDKEPKLGTRSGDVIDTGASVTEIKAELLIRGTDAAATMATLQAWSEAGDLLDVPVYNSAGVVVKKYRCKIENASYDVRGGEPGARHVNLDLVVVRRLTLITDEIVAFVAGVGNVAHHPIADADGDGDYTDDVVVRTAAGGGGVAKPVSSVDYVGDDPDAAFSEVTLVDGAFNANGYVTYYYEEAI
jgi:hypothetical protein